MPGARGSPSSPELLPTPRFTAPMPIGRVRPRARPTHQPTRSSRYGRHRGREREVRRELGAPASQRRQPCFELRQSLRRALRFHFVRDPPEFARFVSCRPGFVRPLSRRAVKSWAEIATAGLLPDARPSGRRPRSPSRAPGVPERAVSIEPLGLLLIVPYVTDAPVVCDPRTTQIPLAGTRGRDFRDDQATAS
jgi:hypothetical protein